MEWGKNRTTKERKAFVSIHPALCLNFSLVSFWKMLFLSTLFCSNTKVIPSAYCSLFPCPSVWEPLLPLQIKHTHTRQDFTFIFCTRNQLKDLTNHSVFLAHFHPRLHIRRVILCIGISFANSWLRCSSKRWNEIFSF